MTLDQAFFVILGQLLHIERTEGRMPNITGIHSIVADGDGTASIYVDLDDPNANERTPGVIICNVDERAIAGMAHDEIWETLTGYQGAIFTETFVST